MNEMKNQPEALRLAHLLALDKWPDAAAELRRLHAENQELKEQMAAIGAGGVESLRKRAAPAVVAVQEETHVDNLFDAVLNCPHAITAESVTLHFYPKQEGHTALTQLRHRLATYDLAARQREMQLLGEIEALERLALGVLKQPGATPIAWYVTGCSTMLDEHDAKAEAKRCGGSAKAVPLYAAPQPPAVKESLTPESTVNQQLTDHLRCATEMMPDSKSGKFLTVVYRDIQPGDEARAIGEHPKVSALSWSHALRDLDAAIVVQAKKGAAMTRTSAEQEVAKERTARKAAQEELAELKERIARAGVEQRRAVLEERAACAKACEGLEANRDWVPGSLWGNIRSEMAAAIRARK